MAEEATVPVSQPMMNLGQMKAIEFPYVWGNKDLGGVYRRQGRMLATLDKTMYADLYAKLEGEGGGEDPGTGEPEGPGTEVPETPEVPGEGTGE